MSVWSGPAWFDRKSEGSGTLAEGDHEGDSLDHLGAMVVGAPGARYTGTVTVRKDVMFVGVRFTGLVNVIGDATAMFEGCVFSKPDMPLVTADALASVHLVGCRFTEAAGSGDVLSGSAIGLAFMSCCSNKTTRPVGATVTTFGVTT